MKTPLNSAWSIVRYAGPARLIFAGIGVLAILAVAWPALLTPWGPNQIDVTAILKGPSWHHWLGTDEEGSDVLSRLIFGTRLDILLALGSAGIATAVGLPAGIVAGYLRGRIDMLMRSLAIGTLAFPLILFAVLVVASFGASLGTLVLVLGFLFAPQLFLVARAQTKAVREREFVTAANVSGIRTSHILRRHILPNMIGPVMVLIPQLMATAILAEAGLSFLGLGVQPPSVTWGTILLDSKEYYTQQPTYAIAGGVMVTLAAVYFIFLGDMISESLNPKMRRRRSRAATPALVGVSGGSEVVTELSSAPDQPSEEAPAQGSVERVAPSPASVAPSPATVPAAGGDRSSVLLDVEGLSVTYRRQGGESRTTGTVAVDSVSFQLGVGRCLGLVGESGSGKSSIARAVARVIPSSGKIAFAGADLLSLRGETLRNTRREIQLIFQNPQGSINPRMRVARAIREPMQEHRLLPERQLDARVEELMLQVGFDPSLAGRYPYQLSGGQCQRVAIARALGLGARLLICDEVTSALDVSVQAQIINLLKDLQSETLTSFLFISHNLAVVRQVATDITVIYRGRIVEIGPTALVLGNPRHPYTQQLLSSVPRVSSDWRESLSRSGTQSTRSSAPAPSKGCPYATSCPHVIEECRRVLPEPEIVAEGHSVRCIRWQQIGEERGDRIGIDR